MRRQRKAAIEEDEALGRFVRDRLAEGWLQEIVFTANLTPCKCLGYKTPFRAMLAALGKDFQIRFA